MPNPVTISSLPASANEFKTLFSLQMDERFDMLPQPQRQVMADLQFEAQKQSYQSHWPAAIWYTLSLETECIGRLIINEDDNEVRIIDIYISPAQRNNGVAREILTELIQRALAQRKSVALTVATDNPAQHLYRRLGFVEECRNETDISMKLSDSPKKLL